jgi:hypothetical protein
MTPLALDESSEAQRLAEATESEIASIVSGSGPIVVGPWLSEVGFEVLYWIPFLRWLVARFEVDPDRLHVVSRGGTASWYEGIAGHYADLLEAIEPDEFRQHSEMRSRDVGTQKQIKSTKWDHEVLRRVGLGGRRRRKSVLHPSLMYRLFDHFWRGLAPLKLLADHTRIAPFSPPSADHWADRLPSGEFVAVKFYFRPSFPDTPENRRRATEIVAALSQESDVVLLNTGLPVDEHVDMDPVLEGRVHRLLEGVPPAQNLHLQSIAISRSRAFVGTYGGLSYLAPMYGRGSVAFFSETGSFLTCHLDFARHATAATGGYLITASAQERGLLGLIGNGASAGA